MSVSITQVPGSGVTPNAGRGTWNTNDQALADEINAHEASTTSAHGGLISLPNLDWKPSARAATTANITLSGAQTIDGVSVVAGDRVLVKNQTTGSDNGIYVAASGAWSRATDAASSATVHSRMTVAVSEGTANGALTYQLSTTGAITLGTTALTFGVLGSAALTPGSYTISSITVGANGLITSVSSGAAGGVADASSSVKGATLLTVNPVSSTSPIAVGSNDPMLQTRIEGLALTWDSATVLGVETGCAWIPSLNKVLDVPTRLTLTVSSPGVNTKQYIYLTSSGTLVASATVPVAYKGNASQMTGDNAKRYLGMVIGNAAGTGMYKWTYLPGDAVRYQETMAASPFRLGTAFNATTPTNVACSSVVPPTTDEILLYFISSTSSNDIVLSNSAANFTLSSTNYLYKHNINGAIGNNFLVPVELDGSQQFSYMWTGTAASTPTFAVRGYREAR